MKTKTRAMKHWTIFTEETTFNFGKHAGETLEKVAKTDVRYILWCVRKIDKFLIEKDLFISYGIKYPHFIEGYDPNIKKKGFIDFNKFVASEELLCVLEGRWNAYLNSYVFKSKTEHQDYDGYDDCDNYSVDNNPFYNDNLDMDQQDPEFWDSF